MKSWMKVRCALLLASFLTFSQAPSAHDIIVPPDPIRLAAARGMVDQLPIAEVCLSRYGPCQDIGERAKDWLEDQAADAHDEVKRAFVAKVRASSIQLTHKVEKQVKEQLVKHYAYAMTVSQLTETERFLATDAGRSYSRASVVQMPMIASLWKDSVYQEVSPEFTAILDDAKNTVQLMRAVNAGQ